MKVRGWIEKEIETDVPLRELLANLPESGEPEVMEELLVMLSRCGACIDTVPSELIEKMSSEHGILIGNFLRRQADRFAQLESETDCSGTQPV